jgi:hypothetical protein
VVSVRGAGGGRVSIAGVVCYQPGDRPKAEIVLSFFRDPDLSYIAACVQ